MSIIRAATRPDATAILQAGRDAPEFQISTGGGFWTINQLVQWIDASSDVVLVAEQDATLAGFILSQHHLPTGKATIENLYVAQQYRHQGIGSALVSECMARLRMNGCQYIAASAKETTPHVKELLIRNGFEPGYTFTWMGAR